MQCHFAKKSAFQRYEQVWSQVLSLNQKVPTPIRKEATGLSYDGRAITKNKEVQMAFFTITCASNLVLMLKKKKMYSFSAYKTKCLIILKDKVK